MMYCEQQHQLEPQSLKSLKCSFINLRAQKVFVVTNILINFTNPSFVLFFIKMNQVFACESPHF